LPDETPTEREAAKKFIEGASTAYLKMKRSPDDGPRSIGKSLNLSADFYSYAYLHKFKRKVIFDDDLDSDEEREKKEETDPAKRW